MTGSRCKNGTGIVDCQYDPDYLSDEANKVSEDMDYIDDYQMDISYSSGSCTNFSNFINREKNQKVEPPKMEVPDAFEDLLDLEEILGNDNLKDIDNNDKNDFNQIVENLNIPDAPKDDIRDTLFKI